MEMNQVQHVPVMLDRCVALLTPALENREEAVVVDATIGLGGHAEALLEKFPRLHLIGIDRDERALARSRERLSQFASRINFIHAVYDQIPTLLSEMGIKGVAGILFDLGVSSLQIDDFERGFSYSRSAPLDMRMDKSSVLTASNVINDYSQEALSRLIKDYGEEKFANRIAKNIVKARESRKIENTDELVEIIKASIPAPARRLGGNPAKRTFQAIRIEVNQELEILKRAIPQAISCIELHGRMVVMSFQSLEDRIVKQAFADVTKSKSPVGLPIELKEHKAKFRLVFNGSETPDESEISRNPRSQSVRLRAIERIAI